MPLSTLCFQDTLTILPSFSVISGSINSPLLYINTSDVSLETKDVLYELGVKNIYLINLGDYLNKNVKEEINDLIDIKKEFTEYDDIYTEIQKISNSNDVVFSTIDPWTHWYVAELKPANENYGSRFIGPAAYIAAHHGSPVVIVDNHPELSSSLVWHNELWRRHPDGYSKLPTVSEMYLTGTRIYE